MDGLETYFASSCQISWRSVNPLLRYRDFCDFQDGGRRHIGFSKIRNFNGQSTEGARCVSVPNFTYQNRSNGCRDRQAYGDLAIPRIRKKKGRRNENMWHVTCSPKPPTLDHWRRQGRGAQGAQAPNGWAKKEFFVISVTDILKISKITWNYLHFFYKISQKISKLLQSPVHLVTHNN